jgi:hypothetical protein
MIAQVAIVVNFRNTKREEAEKASEELAQVLNDHIMASAKRRTLFERDSMSQLVYVDMKYDQDSWKEA